jgi:spermidine synthase
MQIHRLSRLDLVTILASVRAEFPYVWLYFAPNQGVIVACAWDCSPSRQSVARLRGEPALQDSLSLTGGVPRLLEQRLLSPADVDRLIATELPAGARPEEIVSTDDNLFLEYSTPRANVRPYGPSLQENLRILGGYRPSSFLIGTRLEAGDANQ